jgi:PAT family beta-lactamase induction signal transducer AmpG
MNWFLAENRVLRFASFAVFYIAQGIPLGLLTVALPAWLAEQDVEASDIAYFISISTLPWAFKLIAGPIMDRYSFLEMGRRRPWIVCAQAGLLLAMIGLAFVPDPTNNIMLLTWMAFAVNCFAAVQDVAVDGMAIDVLPENERGRANSFMAFGQVSGYAASGALSALALVQFGLFGASLMLALAVSLIFVWGIVARERRGERVLPWTEGGALDRSISLQADDFMSIAINLRLVFFLKASLLMILLTALWRISNGFWLVGVPVIATQDLGYASTQYSYWMSAFSLMAAVLGLLLGPFIDLTGAQRILMMALITQSALMFGIGFSVDYWSEPWLPIAAAAIEALSGQAIFICFISVHMSICWQRVSATQFAIYMAWANLARSIGANIYGQIESSLGPGQEFLIMGVIVLLAAGVAQLVNIKLNQERLERLEAQAA